MLMKMANYWIFEFDYCFFQKGVLKCLDLNGE